MSSGNECIAVLGAGSWGTALALALARNNHTVTLWAHNEQHVESLIRDTENKQYLAGFTFPDNLTIESDLSKVTKAHKIILVVVPSHAFRSTVSQLKDIGLSKDALLIWATKGFDPKGPCLLSDVIEQELGQVNCSVITGPSFSKEVAANLPTALTVAGNSTTSISKTVSLFHSEHTRVYSNNDLIGVQIGGATKNVMAIAAGISDGLGFGANSRAAIITRGLAEISRLGIAMGAEPETFIGLTGLGDLVLTCTDNQSRNRQLGLGIGQGNDVQSVIKSIGQQVEGYYTVNEVVKLAKKFDVEMPIVQQVYNILYNGVAPEVAVKNLLSRTPSGE